MTALTDTVALTIRVTFDYYTMYGGEANTYLNSNYYMGIYNELLQQLIEYYATHDPSLTLAQVEAKMLENDPTAQNIVKTKNECPGWVCKVDNEIESVYKSMGVRIGVQAKF
jgi:hypothetical protein